MGDGGWRGEGLILLCGWGDGRMGTYSERGSRFVGRMVDIIVDKNYTAPE